MRLGSISKFEEEEIKVHIHMLQVGRPPPSLINEVYLMELHALGK
jgi:hypothetical protein